MKERHHLVPAALLAVALASGLGCQNEDAAAEAERAAEWAELQEQKADLDVTRARLAELRDQVVGESDAEAADEDGAAPEPDPEARAAEIRQHQNEVVDKADAFGQRLVAFLNDMDPITEGQEPTERQRAALQMKIEEDMAIARQYIDEGGDYLQAIQIYQRILDADPDNQALQDAIAEAQANRYMTEERFARVEEGMSEEQVRAAIGQVNLRNIRDYDDGARIAWFYPREEQGYAAGVFLSRDDDGKYSVYSAEFEAVTPQQQ